jgi:hypothetical protein
VKYRTKLVLANAARQESDVEALTPKEAALKAAGHWDELWKSSRSRTTDAAIHVYEINTGSGDAYSTCALVMLPKAIDVELDAPKVLRPMPQEKCPDKVSTKRSKRKPQKVTRRRRT